MNESFYALSPTDNVTNADHYYAALDWALLDQDTQGNPSLRQNTQGNPPLRQDERVRNVALAGPYGSGKSSILKAYQSKRKDTGLHFLYISLAKFNDNKEKTEDEEKVSNKKEKADERAVQVTGNLKDSKEKADEEVGKEEKAIEDETANEKNRKKGDEQQTEDGKNEVKERTKKIVETETTEDKEKKMRLIEQSILQQLFCREANDILPNSSFKKIDNIKAKIWAWGNIRFIVYVFLFLFALIYVKNPNDFAIWISHLGLGNAWWIHAVALSFLLLTLWIFAGIARVIISKVKINHFTFNHAGIEGKIEIDPKNMSESMLNKSLNEILYFFEATNYNVVVIEDLDRFHNTEIFSKLRELNSLINGYKKIGRNIVFIYAICDDFFEGDDRTKFFDFIIPVMPVVSANSSYGELEKALKGNSNKLSTDLERAMTDLSFYI
ncbi:MAG: hypothetical protein LBN06_01765, partial [Prevotellaceae bacterium]|nr:hypothetical protein [Prevotellaceae bacterium]